MELVLDANDLTQTMTRQLEITPIFRTRSRAHPAVR
jgi:hypothetical protein